MLKKINEGKVESDEGFFIHIVGLECMRYQEDDRYVDFTWAYDPKTRITSIYVTDEISWSQPSGTLINSYEKKKITINIQRAVKLLTGNFKVV